MKYYLIVGEASGDLHASHLMQALQREDPEAEFRYYGGDLMAAVGGQRVVHYRELAYMGIVPVLMHLRTILGHQRRCQRDVVNWRPDALILVDYPGFNLGVARFVRRYNPFIPIYYYISPKIWAWKEYRIRRIRRDVNELFSILPFEVDFYEGKHHYPIHYVGNPTLDEVAAFRRDYHEPAATFARRNGLTDRPIIVLLAGSRRQEIASNLPRMLEAVAAFPEYQAVVAGAPGLTREAYEPYLRAGKAVQDTKRSLGKPEGQDAIEDPQKAVQGAVKGLGKRSEGPAAQVIFGQTYALLAQSRAALVTSGTATLETALLGVPQVVCYHVSCGRLVSLLRRMVLKVKFISLVNLVAGREVVRELVADGMTVDRVRRELAPLLTDTPARQAMLAGYADMARLLGEPGAPQRAARLMVQLLKERHHNCILLKQDFIRIS